MAYYYVNNNAQKTGEHEVHADGCLWLAVMDSKTSLGWHESCRTAVVAARQHFLKVDGCATCSPACHVR